MQVFSVIRAGLLVALALTMPAHAQQWATRDVCDVTEVKLHPELFVDPPLSVLEQRADKIPNGVGNFWKITTPDGAVSHLWGTFHSSAPQILRLPDQVRAEIEAARVVALEIDPTYKTRAEYIATWKSDDQYRPLRSSFRFASLGVQKNLTRWISNRLESAGWGYQSMDELKIGSLVETLLSDPCEDFAAWVIPNQDSLIQTYATISGAQVVGLEPVDRLTTHLNKPENFDTALAVLKVYASYLEPRQDSRPRASAFALYGQGQIGLFMAWDEAAVTAILGPDGPRDYTLMNAYLVDQRNVDFLNASKDMIQDGGAFIAVGAFHLAGEKGMIALYREAGYEVTRVPLPNEITE